MNEKVNYVVTNSEWDENFDEVRLCVCYHLSNNGMQIGHGTGKTGDLIINFSKWEKQGIWTRQGK